VTVPSNGGSARWTAEPPHLSTSEDQTVEAPSSATPTSHAAPSRPSLYTRFRGWRRGRPFVGALLAIIGGAEILLTVSAPLPVVIHFGIVSLLGFAVPILMILCGLMLWFAPHPRAFYASLILLLSLASWITSNLGGFFIGLLIGIVGGSMALAWSPNKRSPSGPGSSAAA
jgi:Family of unknown function (DUF6114)